MNVSHRIDWITATRKFVETERFTDSSLREVSQLVLNELKSIDIDVSWSIERVPQQRFYDFAFKDVNSGAMVNVALKGNNRGVMVVFSGKALGRGFVAEDLVSNLLGRNYKITRLDCAFDVLDSFYSVVDLADMYEAEVAKRGEDTYSFISSPTGSTLYIGARKSDVMVRVYDKGKESHVDVDWLRLEVEFKGALADQLAIQCHGDFRALGLWLQKKVSLQNHPVMEAIDRYCRGSQVPVVKLPVPNSDKVAWLMNVVLPAFNNAFDDEPINAAQVWEAFSDKLLPRWKSVTGGNLDNKIS